MIAGKVSSLVFVKLLGGSVIQRKKLLKAFSKHELNAQEEKTVTFELSPEDFQYVGVDNCWHFAKKAKIMVGDQEAEINCDW